MIISKDPPPNYSAILDEFPLASRRGIIFCYGDVIHNPSGVDVPDHLIVHEQAHSFRQAGDPEAWWNSYIVSVGFRLTEEVIAHHAELAYLKQHASSRQQRRGLVHDVAGRLRNPVYRFGLTKAAARALLVAA